MATCADHDTAAYASHDPGVDLDRTLIAAAKENGADLTVMVSHVPGLVRGGRLPRKHSRHAPGSERLVRSVGGVADGRGSGPGRSRRRPELGEYAHAEASRT